MTRTNSKRRTLQTTLPTDMTQIDAPRAALYLRVSTGRQAESDLSIPDQQNQLRAWCGARGMVIADEFIESGASATDDRRPEFQRMIERACDGSNAIDAIIVHSYSRFFRDSFGLEFYLRNLNKNGVKLISITQGFDDTDPAQSMMRKVVALFDEYQSKENAKHVLRAMKENARQGFWNGARPPYGYRAAAVEQRGARLKKRLEIDDVEAETVRLVYRLFLEGSNGSGSMGVKSIAVWLNTHGYRTRSGANWGVGTVHVMLSNGVYAGVARFNKVNSRTRAHKAESEHVTADVPVIVEPPVFERVQALLKERNPRVTPPRIVSEPILLTGLAVCASCRGAMTLRSGTSRSGKVHRYYSCATCIRQGKTACKGRSIKMDQLDALVTDHILDRLLAPERLDALLASLAARRAERAASVNERIAGLQARADEADDRLRRLYKMVEEGVAHLDDLLRDRITALKAEREAANAALARARGTDRSAIAVPSDKIAAFGALMRERLTSGGIPFRKAYLGAIIDCVEVDDHQIRICGRKDLLEQAVMANGGAVPSVRGFVRRWRTQ